MQEKKKEKARETAKETKHVKAIKQAAGKANDKRTKEAVAQPAEKGAVKTAGKEIGKAAKKNSVKCPCEKKCGGCLYLGMSYEEQLKKKEEFLKKTLKGIVPVRGMIGMENPYHYRNKVNSAFARKKDGTIISGIYEQGTHKVVPVEECLLEDLRADAIIRDIRNLLKSFKIMIYNEDSGYGLLRHVMVRTGFTSGEIMVVLVCVSPIFPSKNNFVKALRKLHPEITTIVLNVNDRDTSMVLGKRDIVLYGRGYIEDELCGCTFRISPQSFYQVNPIQTKLLYEKAISLAGLTGKERVLDAYCGIGTIGLIASREAREVISVELNPDAIRDAIANAKRNQIRNVTFFQGDAGEFMVNLAAKDEKVDVVFLDPPRAGSDEAFLSSVVKLAPEKVVYVSCNPETLARDLKYLQKHGYQAKEAYGYDMFAWADHVESVTLLSL
ncbi:MAG: 23S rRNA (uracil(1939)-C(5))-methyltransferase RlmD [Fusicatenibacter sp.]